MRLTSTPVTDNLQAAMEFKYRLDECLSKARTKLNLKLPYEVQIAWVKVFYNDIGGKVYCFIDIDTGGIHRVNNARCGIPGERGNLYADDFGVDCMEPEGIKKKDPGLTRGFKFATKVPRPNRKKAVPFVHPTLIRIPE